MNRRGSGLILHITSLPSAYGIGDLGPGAYTAVDFLTQAGQSFWQILPLTPTSGINGHSPYSSSSAFAGNPLLISPDLLAADGLVSEQDLEPIDSDPSSVDYLAAEAGKERLLEKAFERFQATEAWQEDFQRFCRQHADWLDDFALFQSAKKVFEGRSWQEWPEEIKHRQPHALADFSQANAMDIRKTKFVQFLFYRQWAQLKTYANERSIQIIGDLPIYVSFDSAEVWSQPDRFKLEADGTPTTVAGVPPDYFSRTGQLWGNPVYNWDRMQEEGFQWWLHRLVHTFRLYDIVRIDHFRGFVGYWEIPYGEETAVNGWWTQAPATSFFRTLLKRFPCLPLIAEDLGEITPDVRETMHLFGFPGMKVLVFAFYEDNPLHPFLPHTYAPNSVVYTGTHDTNTVLGWLRHETDARTRERLYRYLGREIPETQVPWELIRLAMASVANKAIFPMQDVLALPESARMNMPSTTSSNWAWRVRPEELNPDLARSLANLTRTYGR